MASTSQLKFLSLKPSETTRTSETILIIHGAFSSHAAFIQIAQSLQSTGYHILLPDLPAHGSGSSGTIQPFSISTSTTLLADLITHHAQNGKVHIVGFSLGASIALALAAEHPLLVDRLYCSGKGKGWEFSSLQVRIASVVMYSMSHAPSFLGSWFNAKHKIEDPKELVEDAERWKDRRTLALHHDVVQELVVFGRGDVLDRVRCPVLLVAASAHDSVDGARSVCARLKKNGEGMEVRAVELVGWPHAWCARDPELFARSVVAWMTGTALPSEFVEID